MKWVLAYQGKVTLIRYRTRDIRKMLCHAAEHRAYVAMLPRPITTPTALYIMIAHSIRECKEMTDRHDF